MGLSALSTPIATVEARGMPSPKSGDGLPGETGDQSALISEAPTAGAPAPKDLARITSPV